MVALQRRANQIRDKNTGGFTLVELSIVLIIIGLIIGGILVGKDLIRNAELRSVLTDIEQFRAAANTFKSKYNALPGDMTNAENFWGSDTPCPDGGLAYDTKRTITCNGNGDGIINFVNSNRGEAFRFWQQLSNAGLISWPLTGIAWLNSDQWGYPGQNVPSTRISADAGYFARYADAAIDFAGSGDMFTGAYGNFIRVGANDGSYWLLKPSLTAQDAYWLDMKMDDGRPGTGRVLGQKPGFWTPNCSTTSVESTSEYNFTYSGLACNINVTNAF